MHYVQDLILNHHRPKPASKKKIGDAIYGFYRHKLGSIFLNIKKGTQISWVASS